MASSTFNLLARRAGGGRFPRFALIFLIVYLVLLTVLVSWIVRDVIDFEALTESQEGLLLAFGPHDVHRGDDEHPVRRARGAVVVGVGGALVVYLGELRATTDEDERVLVH